MLKVNNRNGRTKCEICSKLTIKTAKRRQCCRSGVFVVNFEHISYLVLVFAWLTLNMQLPARRGFILVFTIDDIYSAIYMMQFQVVLCIYVNFRNYNIPTKETMMYSYQTFFMSKGKYKYLTFLSYHLLFYSKNHNTRLLKFQVGHYCRYNIFISGRKSSASRILIILISINF